MAALPGAVLWNPRWQARNDDDEPLPGAKLYAWETGGTFSTPQALYSDVDLEVPLSNPVEADEGGFFPEMFMLPEGYDLSLFDADDNPIRTAINVEDIGQAFLSSLGAYQAEGRRDLEDGDTILDSDLLVTVDGTGGPDPCVINLQPVADRTEQLVIMNVGDVDVEITPDGSEMVNFVAAAFVLPAGTTPNWPSVTLLPSVDDSSYLVVSAPFVS